MKLSEVQSAHTVVRLVCEHCGSHQPAYPHIMLEKHSPDTEIEIALRLWPCMFCEQVGSYRVSVSHMSRVDYRSGQSLPELE